MHGTLEHLRNSNPGKWLLILLDGPDAEEGTVLFAHDDPETIDAELEKWAYPRSVEAGPLYLTYALAEGEKLPAFAL
ncbi:MAG: hypothetical protein ACR2HO_07225 [Rubrobacteraceae bacterium]|jgi:hypothetical protein|nr:hypothetical protein [Rubrobacter sp.]